MLTRGSVYWAFGQAQSQDAAVFNLEYRSGAARSAATVNRAVEIFFQKNSQAIINEKRHPYSDDEINYYEDTCLDNTGIHMLSIDDLEFISFISKGAFGRVWLVKRKKTDDFYALKIINMYQ